MENLARYIIRASFSQERMTYLPEESRIIYRSKDHRQEKTFEALDWLAAIDLPRPPDPGGSKPVARCYGFYSNVSRGRRQRGGADVVSSTFASPGSRGKRQAQWRLSSAPLIQKIAACP